MTKKETTTTPKKLTKRQRQAQMTRQKIFDTAVYLFSSIGYDQVTVDDIVKTANTSKGAFYSYFKSKESIVVEVVRGADSQYIEWYEQVEKSISTEMKLQKFFEIVNVYANDIGVNTIKILYMNQIGLDTEQERLLNDETRPYFQIIQRIITHGQDVGEIRTDMSDSDLARLITRWVRSVLYDWCLHNGRYDVVEDGRRYLATVFPSLAKRT